MWQGRDDNDDPFAEFDGRTSRRRPTYYDQDVPLSGTSSKPNHAFILAHCRRRSPSETCALSLSAHSHTHNYACMHYCAHAWSCACQWL
jgi:hypothetical protein